MNAYLECYKTYMRSRKRKTLNDIENLEAIAIFLRMEGLNLLTLRNRIMDKL